MRHFGRFRVYCLARMQRRAIIVRGTVQGVGFRPFVHGLASRLGLGGAVRNVGGAVHIEVEGEETALERFLADLAASPPPLARIDEIASEPRPPLGERTFRIDQSRSEPEEASGQRTEIIVSPDVATCDDCLAELFDRRDRRYRYPFLNCTNCGPRLTIIRGAP